MGFNFTPTSQNEREEEVKQIKFKQVEIFPIFFSLAPNRFRETAEEAAKVFSCLHRYDKQNNRRRKARVGKKSIFVIKEEQTFG
jgi:hypothetical protein